MHRRRLYLLAALIWGVLWVFPWQAWMGGNIWLKLGISLIILIMPGAFLYRLLEKKGTDAINFLIFGFILSHMLLALMGTAGRLSHVSFSLIANGFMALGLILLAANALADQRGDRTSHPGRCDFRRFIPYLPLALAIILAALMTIQRVISDDDLAYLAYLTNLQHMPAMDFKDVYFGADHLTMTRMWILTTPFSQGFLAERSGVHGIVIETGYYEPFLAILACLALYKLARDLGLSRRAASLAVIVQIACLALLSEYLHPGAPFFRQLSTDKATAAFIFAPAFFQSLTLFLRRPGTRFFLILFLTGLGLSLMHPVIAAFSVLIAGGIAFFSLTRDNLRQRIVFGVLALLILSPYAAIRLVATADQAYIPYDASSILTADGLENMITMWGQGPFYGFNLSVLEIPASYLGGSSAVQNVAGKGWILIPILAALVALRGVRRDILRQYIVSSFLLCVLAGFPLTGWILGRLFSAWMLERTTWLFPYGIGITYLLLVILQRARAANWEVGTQLHLARTSLPLATISISALWFIVIAVTLHVMRIQNLPNFQRLRQTTERYQQLANVGRYLDTALAAPGIVVASDGLNDFLPALSWKAKVLSYRPNDPSYPYFLTTLERARMYAARRDIFSDQISLEDRMALIAQYDVKFLVVQGAEYDIFKPMTRQYPADFAVTRIGRYILIGRN